jgi:hypothetical protein
MAEETQQITSNHRCVTLSDIGAETIIDEVIWQHTHELLHMILGRLDRFDRLLTPEALALLDKITNNPAMRWKNRRNP